MTRVFSRGIVTILFPGFLFKKCFYDKAPKNQTVYFNKQLKTFYFNKISLYYGENVVAVVFVDELVLAFGIGTDQSSFCSDMLAVYASRKYT